MACVCVVNVVSSLAVPAQCGLRVESERLGTATTHNPPHEGSCICFHAALPRALSLTQADVLCGRIGILHLGKLQCVGTQLRLKNR